MEEKTWFQDGLLAEEPDGIVLLGSRCRRCGRTSFPKVDFCVECLGTEFDEVRLSRGGTLYAYTITRVPVGSFKPPFATGIVQIDENQVRVTAPLVIDENRPFQVGAPVRLTAAPLWEEDGRSVWGYKYEMVGDDI